MRRPYLSIIVIFALSFALAGCSSKPSMVPVSGTVTLNGQPIENCKVCFYPEAEDANPLEAGYGIGWTDSQGRYHLENSIGEAGIFPGRYKVVLVYFTDSTGKVLNKHAKPSKTEGAVNQIPKEYQDPSTTPELVDVPRKGLTKDFIITK